MSTRLIAALAALALAPAAALAEEGADTAAEVAALAGANCRLTAAWWHPMNGEKGGAAPSDPKTDQFLVQAQAKF